MAVVEAILFVLHAAVNVFSGEDNVIKDRKVMIVGGRNKFVKHVMRFAVRGTRLVFNVTSRCKESNPGIAGRIRRLPFFDRTLRKHQKRYMVGTIDRVVRVFWSAPRQRYLDDQGGAYTAAQLNALAGFPKIDLFYPTPTNPELFIAFFSDLIDVSDNDVQRQTNQNANLYVKMWYPVGGDAARAAPKAVQRAPRVLGERAAPIQVQAPFNVPLPAPIPVPAVVARPVGYPPPIQVPPPHHPMAAAAAAPQRLYTIYKGRGRPRNTDYGYCGNPPRP